jgi:hypothetical protein
MKSIDPKNVETYRAIYGIHLGLCMLLSICFAAYDGLEHTYPILIGYMFIGWVIPLVLRRFVKKMVSRPVSPIRSNINVYASSVVLMVLGTLGFISGVFIPQFGSITINGETITKSDPRFAHEELMFRVGFSGIGLLFAISGYFIFRYIRKRRKNNQAKESKQEQ